MTRKANRFDDFFRDAGYVHLKNKLYNYLVRKRAIERELQGRPIRLLLDAGSGISPVVTGTARVVYSDLSFPAMRMLNRSLGQGYFVVADAARLPFRDGAFSHAVASEVLEHVEDDNAVLRELERATSGDGTVVVTVPHRQAFFANDDRYVNHYRRYDLNDILRQLRQAGLEPSTMKKVLGPLEKLTMMAVVLVFERFSKGRTPGAERPDPGPLQGLFVPFNRLYAYLIRLDAWLAPRQLASCLLIRCGKQPRARE